MVDGWGISCEIGLMGLSLELTDDKSTSVQVMAGCHQATSHYLSQYWPISMSSYGITWLKWVKWISCWFIACRNHLLWTMYMLVLPLGAMIMLSGYQDLLACKRESVLIWPVLIYEGFHLQFSQITHLFNNLITFFFNSLGLSDTIWWCWSINILLTKI